jgi:hypothetical protein
MYDTTNFRLLADNVEGGFTDAVKGKVWDALDRPVMRNSSLNGEQYIEGWIGNFFVRMFANVLILKGSLWKYTMGNQYDKMSLDDVRRAFLQLSKTLGLPMEKAWLTRLDFAQNMEVDHKPEAYNFYLGEASRYVRAEFKSTLYYQQNSKQNVFYDKNKQMRSDRDTAKEIPLQFCNRHILRFEIRFMKQVSKQLKQNVTGETLMSREFYEKMLQIWESAYYAIQKRKDVAQLDSIENVKDFKQVVFAKGVQALGGISKMTQILKQKKLEGNWSKKQVDALKKALKDIADDPQANMTSPLIAELDRKISQAAQEGYKQAKKVLPEVKL